MSSDRHVFRRSRRGAVSSCDLTWAAAGCVRPAGARRVAGPLPVARGGFAGGLPGRGGLRAVCRWRAAGFRRAVCRGAAGCGRSAGGGARRVAGGLPGRGGLRAVCRWRAAGCGRSAGGAAVACGLPRARRVDGVLALCASARSGGRSSSAGARPAWFGGGRHDHAVNGARGIRPSSDSLVILCRDAAPSSSSTGRGSPVEPGGVVGMKILLERSWTWLKRRRRSRPAHGRRHGVDRDRQHG